MRVREVRRTEVTGLPDWEQSLETGGGEGSGPGDTQRARWLGHRPLGDLTASNSASDLGLVGIGH